eukprot:2105409-Rhodomonas_salina.1
MLHSPGAHPTYHERPAQPSPSLLPAAERRLCRQLARARAAREGVWPSCDSLGPGGWWSARSQR